MLDTEQTEPTCGQCDRLRAIEAAARQWFVAHQAHVADQRDSHSPVGEPATALRLLAELLAA